MTGKKKHRPPGERLREAYGQIEATDLEPDVKIAVEAVIAIRQIVDWSQTVQKGVGYQVDPAIVKYIRASSAPDLPQLVHDVITKLPFDLVYKPALGDYVLDIYPQGKDGTLWQNAYRRLKRETIPLVLLSKKFYQDTEEEALR